MSSTRSLHDADALAVITEWNQFRNPDFAKIKKALNAPILFDGRNLYSPTLMAAEGFAYFCVGR
jgi:UDPglucose 6-dehydrogenase